MQSEPDLVSHADRLLALGACPGFDTLGTLELGRAAAMLHARVFSPGEVLAPGGVPLSSIQLLVEGSVELVQSNGARTVLRPRNVVGTLAELLDDVNAERVVAREATLALGFDRADLEDLLEDDFSVFLGLLRGLAQRATARAADARGAAASPRVTSPARRDAPLDLVDLILLLKKQPYFARAELAALAALGQQAERVAFTSGSPLVSIGAIPEGFLILTAGRVLREAGRDSVTLGPGDQLGVLEALAAVRIGFTAVADGEVSALYCKERALVDLAEDYPSLGLGLLHALAHEARG